MTKGILADKSAVVTGAGRGIGRAIALHLAGLGAKVLLAARTEKELASASAEIEASGGTAVIRPTDLSREKECIALIGMAWEKFNRLDILVNNAGIGLFGPLETMSSQQWEAVVSVNARAPFILCREAIPLLRRQTRSFIINISSVVGNKGYPNQSLYSASKHAVMGMSKALAKEVQSDGIRVHVICPGGVNTAMAGNARPDLDPSILMSPEDVADIVGFLVTRSGNAAIDEISVRRESSTPWA